MGWRGFKQACAVTALVGLAACGGYSLNPFGGDGEDHSWREAYERRCVAKGLVQASAYVQPKPPINERGACGIHQPFEVQASLYGTVYLEPGATLDCNMTAALEYWLEVTVQPAAIDYFGASVREARVLSSYSCRTRNSKRGAKMSEHAFGNAIDIAAFTLADGREISVKRDWHRRGPESAFLRHVHTGACEAFKTVLGPDADRYHHDHFHLDLARHALTGDRRYCR